MAHEYLPRGPKSWEKAVLLRIAFPCPHPVDVKQFWTHNAIASYWLPIPLPQGRPWQTAHEVTFLSGVSLYAWATGPLGGKLWQPDLRHREHLPLSLLTTRVRQGAIVFLLTSLDAQT